MTNNQLIESCAQAARLHRAGIINDATLVALTMSYRALYLANKVVM